MATCILRFQQTESRGFVLLRSEQNDTLDMKLLATDGEAVYTTLVRARKTSSLRASNAPCTQEEFDSILFDILRGKPVAGIKVLQDLEVVAAVDKEKSITLTIKKRTEGITQRLGTITLKHDEDEEIDIPDWCDLAVQAGNASRDELLTCKSELETQKNTIAKLTKQLEDLLEAKQQHEDLLLEKVALLLNEKKLKIRDQQRLLSTAKVDEKKLAEVIATRRPGGSKAPEESSKNKRKGPTPNDDDESDDAFDRMDVDDEQGADDSEQESTATPSETEDEGEKEAPPPPPPSKVKGRIGGRATRGPSKEEVGRSVENAGKSSASSAASQHKGKDAIPPPRQLPFASAKKAAPTPAPKPTPQPQFDAADESTESDDEL